MTVRTNQATKAETGAARQLIFVVEDDEGVARLVMRALEEFGHPVEWFRDGTTALRRLQTERPDLCVVDLGLPDMDGIELIRKVTALTNCGCMRPSSRA